MVEVEPITDDATYKRVQARLIAAMHKPRSAAEEEELRLLGQELSRYAQERFQVNRIQTDGPDEIEFMLDQGIATLHELEEVIGGRERFIEYMTRRRNLDPATIDAVVANFDTERESIDKPFRRPEGWQDIAKEMAEPCDNLECCPPEWQNQHDWRAELREHIPSAINTDRQDTGRMLDAAQVP